MYVFHVLSVREIYFESSLDYLVMMNNNFFLEFSDYEAFKEAAEQFQPYIKFFATFEKSVSQKNKTD